MEIDIFADVICPWCYIGKHRLQRALAAYEGDDPALNWHPFQLNPDLPPKGVDRETYLATKFGSPERARRVYDEIAKIGGSEGIAFAFDLIQRTPNTVKPHRLIRLAHKTDRQDALVEMLFRRYFLEGADIGDSEELANIAAEVGLDEGKTGALLSTDSDPASGGGEEPRAHQNGITGVPCFVIDRRFAVSGAQSPEVLLRVFETAAHCDGVD